MGLIKEPLDIDFVVDPRPLTKDEELAISAYIKADREKRASAEKRKKRTSRVAAGVTKRQGVKA